MIRRFFFLLLFGVMLVTVTPVQGQDVVYLRTDPQYGTTIQVPFTYDVDPTDPLARNKTIDPADEPWITIFVRVSTSAVIQAEEPFDLTVELLTTQFHGSFINGIPWVMESIAISIILEDDTMALAGEGHQYVNQQNSRWEQLSLPDDMNVADQMSNEEKTGLQESHNLASGYMPPDYLSLNSSRAIATRYAVPLQFETLGRVKIVINGLRATIDTAPYYRDDLPLMSPEERNDPTMIIGSPSRWPGSNENSLSPYFVGSATANLQIPTELTLDLLEDYAPVTVLEGISNVDWTIVKDEVNGVPMVQVPAGCFFMGVDTGEQDDLPVTYQCLDEEYWIDQTEVTREQYTQCVSAGACEAIRKNEVSHRDTQPINEVSWDKAQTYCQWRDARLPTAMEWEYAARGPDSLLYPWGNEFEGDNVVSGGLVTEDVGSRPGGISWVGAYDMSGNVGEWTSTPYMEYPNIENYVESRGSGWVVEHGYNPVMTGGGFYYPGYGTRPENDLGLMAGYLGASPRLFDTFGNGFRCARASIE